MSSNLKRKASSPLSLDPQSSPQSRHRTLPSHDFYMSGLQSNQTSSSTIELSTSPSIDDRPTQQLLVGSSDEISAFLRGCFPPSSSSLDRPIVQLVINHVNNRVEVSGQNNVVTNASKNVKNNLASETLLTRKQEQSQLTEIFQSEWKHLEEFYDIPVYVMVQNLCLFFQHAVVKQNDQATILNFDHIAFCLAYRNWHEKSTGVPAGSHVPLKRKSGMPTFTVTEGHFSLDRARLGTMAKYIDKMLTFWEAQGKHKQRTSYIKAFFLETYGIMVPFKHWPDSIKKWIISNEGGLFLQSQAMQGMPKGLHDVIKRYKKKMGGQQSSNVAQSQLASSSKPNLELVSLSQQPVVYPPKPQSSQHPGTPASRRLNFVELFTKLHTFVSQEPDFKGSRNVGAHVISAKQVKNIMLLSDLVERIDDKSVGQHLRRHRGLWQLVGEVFDYIFAGSHAQLETDDIECLKLYTLHNPIFGDAKDYTSQDGDRMLQDESAQSHAQQWQTLSSDLLEFMAEQRSLSDQASSSSSNQTE